MRLRKGQSTLEYIILVTMIVAALIVLASDTGGLRSKIQDIFAKSGAKVQKANDLLGEKP